MKGLEIGPVSGTVKIIRPKGAPIDAKLGYQLKHGEKVQLGDDKDSSCWLMYGSTPAVQLFKPRNGKMKLAVKTFHPPCRTVKKLAKEFVVTAFPHGNKKRRGARTLRDAY